MKHLLFILLTATLCATASAQSIRSLGYNSTNGNVVANTGTNALLTFTNETVRFASGDLSISNQSIVGNGVSFSFEDGSFDAGGNIVREQLGFNTNLNTLWTATNASNARSAVGLGTNAIVRFEQFFATDTVEVGSTTNTVQITTDGIEFGNAALSANTRTNLGLGATWLTNNNATNFRTAIGLGATDTVTFANGLFNFLTVSEDAFFAYAEFASGTNSVQLSPSGIVFTGNTAATTRTNLSLPLAALTNTSNVTMMRALSGSTNTNHPYSGSISVVGTNNTNTLVFSNGILQSIQ